MYNFHEAWREVHKVRVVQKGSVNKRSSLRSQSCKTNSLESLTQLISVR